MARKKKQKTILDNLAKELFKKNNPVFLGDRRYITRSFVLF